MKDKMVALYLRGKMACRSALQSLKREERGASDIVAILLIIVVLIAVVAIFRQQLMNAITTAFNSLNEALQG